MGISFAGSKDMIGSPVRMVAVYYLTFVAAYVVMGLPAGLFRINFGEWQTDGFSSTMFYLMGAVAMVAGLLVLFVLNYHKPVLVALACVSLFVTIYLSGYTMFFLPIALVAAAGVFFLAGMANLPLGRVVPAVFAFCLVMLVGLLLRGNAMPYETAICEDKNITREECLIQEAAWKGASLAQKTDALSQMATDVATDLGMEPPTVAVVALPAGQYYAVKSAYVPGSHTVQVNIAHTDELEYSVRAVLHGVAHAYQYQRAEGEIPASDKWPYSEHVKKNSKDARWSEEIDEFKLDELEMNDSNVDTPNMEYQADNYETFWENFVA